MGCPWKKDEIIAAAKRGPHKLALEEDAIEMMRIEVEGKVKDGQVEIVYLDEIEHLISTPK